jgi:hypothetical protein
MMASYVLFFTLEIFRRYILYSRHLLLHSNKAVAVSPSTHSRPAKASRSSLTVALTTSSFVPTSSGHAGRHPRHHTRRLAPHGKLLQRHDLPRKNCSPRYIISTCITSQALIPKTSGNEKTKIFLVSDGKGFKKKLVVGRGRNKKVPRPPLYCTTYTVR